MATKYSNPQIDFNVYERVNPQSQVDWAKAASDITKTFEGIRDVRETKKAAIEKSYQEQQEALNDIGQYDNTTVQQLAIQAAQDAGNKLTDQNRLMKLGLVKPADFTMFNHNVKSGFSLFKKNAQAFDATFKEYSERINSGESGAVEQYLANMLKDITRLDNAMVQTNPETGEMIFLRTDPNNNNAPIPESSMSLQQMTVLMNQRVNAFDPVAEAKTIVDQIGNTVKQKIKSKGASLYTYQKEYDAGLESDKTLMTFAKAALVSDYDIAEFLCKQLGYTMGNEKGEDEETLTLSYSIPSFKNTKEGDAFRQWVNNNHAKYAQDNDLDSQGAYDNKYIKEALDKYGEEYARFRFETNPETIGEYGIEAPTETIEKTPSKVITMSYGEDNLWQVDLTDEEKEIAYEAYTEFIRTAADSAEKVTVQGKNYAPKYLYDRADDKKTVNNVGNALIDFVTKKASDSSAAADYLIASNPNVLGLNRIYDGNNVVAFEVKTPQGIQTISIDDGTDGSLENVGQVIESLWSLTAPPELSGQATSWSNWDTVVNNANSGLVFFTGANGGVTRTGVTPTIQPGEEQTFTVEVKSGDEVYQKEVDIIEYTNNDWKNTKNFAERKSKVQGALQKEQPSGVTTTLKVEGNNVVATIQKPNGETVEVTQSSTDWRNSPTGLINKVKDAWGTIITESKRFQDNTQNKTTEDNTQTTKTGGTVR